jgi:hypothetical protein
LNSSQPASTSSISMDFIFKILSSIYHCDGCSSMLFTLRLLQR